MSVHHIQKAVNDALGEYTILARENLTKYIIVKLIVSVVRQLIFARLYEIFVIVFSLSGLQL